MLHFFRGFCTVFSLAPSHSLMCRELPHSNSQHHPWGITPTQQGRMLGNISEKSNIPFTGPQRGALLSKRRLCLKSRGLKGNGFHGLKGFSRKLILQTRLLCLAPSYISEGKYWA